MPTASPPPSGDLVATGRRYDPVEARAIMATLYTAGTLLAAAIDVLPTWPGVDRRVVVGLTLVGALAASVTSRLRALPLPFAALLTLCGNSLIAIAQAGGGTGTGAMASVYALSLTVAFLMYPTPLLVAQILYAAGAQAAVLGLVRHEGPDTLVTVAVTIGSACSAGVVVRKLADRRAQAEQELAWRASHDGHTGLANRGALTRTWAALPTAPGTTVGVLVLDLRGFEPVNDLLGHHYGDALLVEVGARLHRLAGDDLACRLGGDEFAVLLPGADAEAARQQAETVARALAEPYRVDDADIALSATVGVAAHTWAGERGPADDEGRCACSRRCSPRRTRRCTTPAIWRPPSPASATVPREPCYDVAEIAGATIGLVRRTSRLSRCCPSSASAGRPAAAPSTAPAAAGTARTVAGPRSAGSRCWCRGRPSRSSSAIPAEAASPGPGRSDVRPAREAALARQPDGGRLRAHRAARRRRAPRHRRGASPGPRDAPPDARPGLRRRGARRGPGGAP